MALGFRTMEQSILPNFNFDGTTPAGELTRGDSLEKYLAGETGGAFNFGLEAPVFVRSVEMHLGGQALWTLHKADIGGRELLIMCGTDEKDFVSTLSESFIMTARQILVLRTFGANVSLFCRVTIQSPV